MLSLRNHAALPTSTLFVMVNKMSTSGSGCLLERDGSHSWEASCHPGVAEYRISHSRQSLRVPVNGIPVIETFRSLFLIENNASFIPSQSSLRSLPARLSLLISFVTLTDPSLHKRILTGKDEAIIVDHCCIRSPQLTALGLSQISPLAAKHPI